MVSTPLSSSVHVHSPVVPLEAPTLSCTVVSAAAAASGTTENSSVAESRTASVFLINDFINKPPHGCIFIVLLYHVVNLHAIQNNLAVFGNSVQSTPPLETQQKRVKDRHCPLPVCILFCCITEVQFLSVLEKSILHPYFVTKISRP